MVKPINILVVEDSENDTTLLIQELRDKGYEPNRRRVESAADMYSAIQQSDWDLVVSDYTMPQFSGSAALEMIKQSKLNVPFIFVSGTYGEEAAVHMMKAGASDYIVKGNLSRFVPAVERELRSAQSRRAQTHAETAMHHLAAIVNSSQDAIYSMNLDSSIISWNAAAEKIYGYCANEIVGRSVVTLFPLGRRDELLETIASIRRGEPSEMYETERQRKNGQIIPVYLTASPIKNMQGKIIGASVIARDISKQKQQKQDCLKLITELTEALKQRKTITGQLPICATCKRVRDGGDTWLQIETYIALRSDAKFTHDICPICSNKFYLETGRH